jgi:mannose-1-phosphate guanylyltransferase/phosphomannomutase
MAGGEGTRLRPLTCDRPKPMVPLANRPIMEHIVRLLAVHDFRQVAVTTCYLPQVIEDYFGDGKKWDLTMSYFVEKEPLGTAGSVKNVGFAETFMVISGDALTDIDLSAAMAFHKSRGAMVTIVLKRVPNPLEYGVVLTDEDGLVQRFVEKPGWGQIFSDLVNTGIYIIEHEAMERCDSGRAVDFSRELFPKLLAEGAPIYGWVADGYWSDIGNLEVYRQSHYDLLAGKVQAEPQGIKLADGIWLGKGVELESGASIQGPVVIGDYCQIRSGAGIMPYTVLGPYTVVGGGASLKRSILWDRVFVDGKSALRGAVICSKTRIRQDSELYEGAVVGSDCAIGKGCLVKPQVKIWPGKTIDNGSRLTSSLVWGQRSCGSLICSQGVLGIVNVELTPENVARLGTAWGNTLKETDTVQVSCDGGAESRMLKRALVAGALASGVTVTDFGTLPVPAARLAVAKTKAKAAAHLSLSPGAHSTVLIQFFDEKGLPFGTQMQRKLENIYQREEFRLGRAGEVEFQPGALESYLEHLMVNLPQINRDRQLEPVVAVPRGVLAQFTARFFSSLGLGSVIMEEEVPSSKERGWLSIVQLSQMVVEHGAPFGVRIEAGGERILVVDEQGTSIGEEQMWVLFSKMALEAGQRSLSVPVTAPGVLEEIAEEYGAQITKTDADPRSVLEGTLAREERGLFPIYDAFAFLGQLLAYLSRQNQSLSQFLTKIPNIHRSKLAVPCPWEKRGRVMRQLVEEELGELELVDGIKISQDIGWALVLPDETEPFFQVYSEAQSKEEADLLAAAYMERIGAFQVE